MIYIISSYNTGDTQSKNVAQYAIVREVKHLTIWNEKIKTCTVGKISKREVNFKLNSFENNTENPA